MHKFSNGNAWTTSTNVPQKELHWPLQIYWRLGWCRMLQVLVLLQHFGCCPVVVGCYLMLCHTQCIHNPAQNEHWSSATSVMSRSPPHFKCATILLRSRASFHWVISSLMWFLNERWVLHQSPRDYVDSLTGRSAWPIVIVGISGLWIEVQWNAKLYICGLWIWNHALLPILVRQLLPAVIVFLWYQGSSNKTDPRIINKECSENGHRIMSVQLVNL